MSEMKQKINLILAVDQSNAIGYSDGRLAHRFPEDLARFKRLTSGSSVLMGRKTFDSLGMPNGLPNRFNIVMTSESGFNKFVESDCNVVFWSWSRKIADVIQDYNEANSETNLDTPLWIIGGATVADQALDEGVIDAIYLTKIHKTSAADVKLRHNLADYESFILNELELGRAWGVESAEVHQDFSFVLITKKDANVQKD